MTITITDPNGQTATAVARAVDPPAASTNPTVPGSVASPAPAASTSPTAARRPRRTRPRRPRQPDGEPGPGRVDLLLSLSTENITLSPNGSFHGIVATFADSGADGTGERLQGDDQLGQGTTIRGDGHGEQRPVRRVGQARLPAVLGHEGGDDHRDRHG